MNSLRSLSLPQLQSAKRSGKGFAENYMDPVLQQALVSHFFYLVFLFFFFFFFWGSVLSLSLIPFVPFYKLNSAYFGKMNMINIYAYGHKIRLL